MGKPPGCLVAPNRKDPPLHPIQLLRWSVSSRSRLQYSACIPGSGFGYSFSGMTTRGLPLSELCTQDSCACPMSPLDRESSTIFDACRQPRLRPRRSSLSLAQQSLPVPRRIVSSLPLAPRRSGSASWALSRYRTVRCSASPCTAHDNLPPVW